MAIKLTTKTNTIIPNADYPFGDIKDESAQGANDGTPINRAVYADFHQFFEKMMNYGSVTHNNLPDNETNGFQIFSSFLLSIQTYMRTINFSQFTTTAPLIGFTGATGNLGVINLPTDGVFRKVSVYAKATFDRSTIASEAILGNHILKLNGVEVDRSTTENDSLSGSRNYIAGTLCLYSFIHEGNGGSITHNFTAVGDSYDITNINLHVVGIPAE